MSNDTTTTKPPLSPALLIVLTSVLLGIGARGIALSYAPNFSYRPDHTDFMAWAEESWRNGPTQIYHKDKPWAVNYRHRGPNGQYLDAPTPIPHACNYLPLSTYIFWMQGGLWSALTEEVTLQTTPQAARLTRMPPGTEVTGLLANTYTARFVGALPSLIFDFVLAWGVAALILALGGGTIPAAFGFAITLLAPPIFLDSAFWNQVDSWVAAPLVWTTAMLVRKKWLLGGVIYGAALLLKPQAILLGPLLLFAAFARFRQEDIKAVVGPILTGVVALVVALVLSLPHSIAGSKIENLPEEDKGWQSMLWFKRAYVDTVMGDLYSRTTLNAFNIWWLDYQASRDPEQRGFDREAADPSKTRMGMSKDRLGKVLLAIGIIVGGVLAGRKWGWQPMSYLGFAIVLTLCAFVLPTRVHERYIYLCIPFVIALAMLRPIWLAAAVPLLIVGTSEMTSFRWALRPEYRTATTLLSVLSCLALLIHMALLLLPERMQRKN